MDRGAWQATVHGAAKSRTPLKRRCPESWELPGALGKFSGGLQGDEAGWPWGSILKEERLSSSKL